MKARNVNEWEAVKVIQERAIEVHQLILSPLATRELKLEHKDSILEMKVEIRLGMEEAFRVNCSNPLSVIYNCLILSRSEWGRRKYTCKVSSDSSNASVLIRSSPRLKRRQLALRPRARRQQRY
jgi:hypothetical protein